jgi:hypothetical protein
MKEGQKQVIQAQKVHFSVKKQEKVQRNVARKL